MRALRARLPNIPNGSNDFNGFTVPPEKHDFNEINDFNGFTVPPENHEINDFNEITIPRPPNGITKATKPTKTTKCLFCGHFVFFVVYGETVISLQPLALDKKRAALYTDKEKNGPPRAGRKRDVVWKPRTPSKPSSTK